MSESERSNDPAARTNGASGARGGRDPRRSSYDQPTEVWEFDWDDGAEPPSGWGREGEDRKERRKRDRNESRGQPGEPEPAERPRRSRRNGRSASREGNGSPASEEVDWAGFDGGNGRAHGGRNGADEAGGSASDRPAPWDLDPEERARRCNGDDGQPTEAWDGWDEAESAGGAQEAADATAGALGAVWSELVGEERNGLRDVLEGEDDEPADADWRDQVPQLEDSEPEAPRDAGDDAPTAAAAEQPEAPPPAAPADPPPAIPDWSTQTDRAFDDWASEPATIPDRPRPNASRELEAEPLPTDGEWWPEPPPTNPTVSFPEVDGDEDPEPVVDDGAPRKRVKIKKLRLIALLVGIGLLAAVSTLFGMLMAVASDLPELEQPPQANSVLLDRNGQDLGKLTGNQNRILLKERQIAPVMKQAIIAIEDRRFYEHDGVDLKGIGRALWADLRSQDSVQGGSTIAQQFVKTSQAAQGNRSVMVKLREAALAFHLTRKWSKNRILLAYLNTVYFGAGAYGVESAARTYFASAHPGCERALDRGAKDRRTCAARLEPHEAALLAGMVQSPTAYDPVQHPQATKQRRDTVLRNMLDQKYLTYSAYAAAVREPLPTRSDLQPPHEDTRSPYFTSWIKQQVVDEMGGGQLGARRAFEGNLTVRTTIDLEFQKAAENAIQQWLPYQSGPRASLVALDNDTSEVLAMVGGDDYNAKPFNLATQGRRQPGSTMKPFVLAEALKKGIGPGSTWESKKFTFHVPNSSEKFVVNNYEDNYAGMTTLARATTYSDNSVYTQVGIKVGPKRIARLARRMGIRTPVSHNYAIPLGALRTGVKPLDLAHAYQTFARNGKFTYGTLSPGEMSDSRRDPVPGPVGIREIRRRGSDDPIKLPSGETARNRPRQKRVLSEKVAGTVTSLLQSVVKQGTGTRAQIPGEFVAGKTGTTDNYGDAWFVGYTKDFTVAVWVGYPDGLRQMKTEFRGEPVSGGTYPAGIWRTFVEAMLRIDRARHPEKYEKREQEEQAVGDGTIQPAPAPGGVAQPAPAPDGTTGGAVAEPDDAAGDDGDGGTEDATPPAAEEPETEAPAPEAPATEQPATPPSTGGGVQPPPGGGTVNPPPG